MRIRRDRSDRKRPESRASTSAAVSADRRDVARALRLILSAVLLWGVSGRAALGQGVSPTQEARKAANTGETRVESSATGKDEADRQATANESMPASGQGTDEEASQAEPVESTLWLETLDDAVEAAEKGGKPIFAVVSASWCVYCEKLEKEMAGDFAGELSKAWVLVRIDADARQRDARELAAVAFPSIRLLSKEGLIGKAHDGYMPPEELSEWIRTNREYVEKNVPAILDADPSAYSDEQIEQLVEVMSMRDVTLRRIVLQRLSKIPGRCVFLVLDRLESGGLADKLSAIELFREWNAPVEELDPWVPGTIGDREINGLRSWCSERYPAALDSA